MTHRNFFILLIAGMIFHLTAGQIHASIDQTMKRSAVYETHFASVSGGVYERKGEFFIVAEVPRAKGKKRKELAAAAKLQTIRELVHWANKKSPAFSATGSIQSEMLRKELSDFIAQGSTFFEMKNLSVSVLVDKPIGEKYRMVLAGDLKKLNTQLATFQKANSNELALLQSYVQFLVKHKNSRKLSQFLSELGEEFMAARFALSTLAEDYSLANYSKQTNAIVQRRTDMLLLNKTVTRADLPLLAASPANSELMNLLYKELPKDSIKAFSVALLANAAFPSSWTHDVITGFKAQSPSSYMLSNPSSLELSREHIAALVLESGGAYFMDSSIPSSNNPFFNEARSLFSNHAPLAQVQAKLIKAISVSPANPDCWDYFAAVLKFQKNWRDAAAAYRQLLMLQPYNGEALASYAECIWNLGFKNQAKWLSITAMAMAEPNNRKTILTITQRLDASIN